MKSLFEINSGTYSIMEDVRSLYPRSVVINNGKKLYDGETGKLFAAYQTHKRITITFDSETDFSAPEYVEMIEQTPYRAIFMVPKQQSSSAIAGITRNYALADITVEEDDIGVVVERIYAAHSCYLLVTNGAVSGYFLFSA